MSQSDSPLPPEFNAAEFARRWKDLWQGDIEQLERFGQSQKPVVESASETWFRALVRELPAATLWAFLSPKNKTDFNPLRAELRHTALRGFQQTQFILRHPTVQNRIVAWLIPHRGVAHLFLLLWQQKNPEVSRTLDEDADETTLLRVIKTHGPFSTWLGSAYIGSPHIFSEVERLLSTPEIWTEEAPQPTETPQAETPEPADPTPDSDSAHFWHGRAQQLQANIEIKTRELKLTREENIEIPTLRERLRASQKELGKAHKEERARETAWQKKLELIQKTAQVQLIELKKHDERETRRLSAAEKARDELDSTVKVLRKQLRHLNQLLDEQQKKNAALEASLTQQEHSQLPADVQVVDAVSTPPTTQKTKNAPIKVARPNPLDELFRWIADGHEFRATPRETMRHIDRGDVDFVFRTQLALEGVAPQDVAKKNTFLSRLREKDGYYVRVLTEPTQRALVDASNVVRASKNRYGKGELRNLQGMIAELRRLSFFPIELVADASLRHNVDEINAYNEMINRGEVEVVTPGTEADEVLVRKFRKSGGYVITNDARFHFKVSPDLAPPSLSFRVSSSLVIVEDF